MTSSADTCWVEADSPTSPEQERRFADMFGVSEAELKAQGVDIQQYVHENAKRGVNRLYELSERKLATGESVLPYEPPSPYIAKGVSIFSRDRSGSISVDRAAVRIVDADGSILANEHPAQVRVRPIPIWLGIGVRLVMGHDVAWCVQPRGFSNQNLWKARRANKVFLAALAEAGAHFGRD